MKYKNFHGYNSKKYKESDKAEITNLMSSLMNIKYDNMGGK